MNDALISIYDIDKYDTIPYFTEYATVEALKRTRIKPEMLKKPTKADLSIYPNFPDLRKKIMDKKKSCRNHLILRVKKERIKILQENDSFQRAKTMPQTRAFSRRSPTSTRKSQSTRSPAYYKKESLLVLNTKIQAQTFDNEDEKDKKIHGTQQTKLQMIEKNCKKSRIDQQKNKDRQYYVPMRKEIDNKNRMNILLKNNDQVVYKRRAKTPSHNDRRYLIVKKVEKQNIYNG